MFRIPRAAAALAAGTVLLAVAAPAAATPATGQTRTAAVEPAGVPGWQPKPIDWQPCAELPDDPTVRCGTLDVPIDWAQPAGATFKLAVAKRAATDPAARIGPLVINPGGPGGSGVGFALAGNRYFSTDIQQRFDIIGFDPRGVARSSPVRCSTDLLAKQPFPVPANQTQYDQLVAYNAALGADCRSHTGPLFDHVDTLSVDRDIDAIRGALGERQISYFGVSYGTLIGQEYAELFPGRVRRMVLDSTMDHALGTTPFLLTQAATDEDSFNEFVAWCDRDTSCALHGQDVPAIWDELMRRADSGVLTDPDGKPLTWWGLTKHAMDHLPQPSWSQLATDLAALYRGAGGQVRPPGRTPAPEAAGDLTENPFPAVFCSDWSVPESGYPAVAELFAQSRAQAPHMRTSTLAWGAVLGCQGWPGRVNNPQHRLRVRTPVPLLVLNSVHDPDTPYTWALGIAGQLGPRGRLVTYQGWGHTVYHRSACTAGYVERYLLAGTLPPAGATCAAVPPSSQPKGKAEAAVPPGSPPGPGGWLG